MNNESEHIMQYEVRGEKGEQCEYERCESESVTLIQFDETKPMQRIWFCASHAGNSVQKHKDAHTVEVSE